MEQEKPKQNRQRNTYMLFIAAGVFLLVQHLLGIVTLIALFLILFGIHFIRTGVSKRGYVLLGIGGIVLVGDNFAFIVAAILLSLGYFYLKSTQTHLDDSYLQKQNIIESVKWNQQPWTLRNMSIWNVMGEITMDLSLAIMEDKEVTIILQGVIGDIDMIIPEDVGVSVSGSVFFGQLDVALEKEAGLLNKIVWQSPNYNTSSNKVKLMISYIVADVDVKFI